MNEYAARGISYTVIQWDWCLLPLWSHKMPNKCCVGNCKGNYDSNKDFVPSYHFPKDPEERERWRNALPGMWNEIVFFIFRPTIIYKMWWLVNVKFNRSLIFLVKKCVITIIAKLNAYFPFSHDAFALQVRLFNQEM